MAREPILDQLLVARLHLDRVEIEELLAKHCVFVVRALVPAHDVASTFDHRRKLGEVVAELHEAILLEMPRGEEVHAPELLLADTLLWHRIEILGVPDLHARSTVVVVIALVVIGVGLFALLGLTLLVLFALLVLVVFVRLPIGIRPPLLDADEERGPVFGPRGPAKLDHAHRLGEVAVSARIELEALVAVLVEIAPRQRDVGGVLVRLVLERLQDREVGGLVPPRESPVRRGVRVERADPPAGRIENGDGVADLPVRVDGEREQVTLVLPSECRDVSEGHQRAGRHRPYNDVDALALLVLGLVAPDYEIRPVIGERERLDVFDLLLFAGPQVHQTQRVMHRLVRLLSRVPRVRRDADRVGEPGSVTGKGGSGPERDHYNGVRVGSVDA